VDNEEKVVRHLEIIQGVINRLGYDSFLIKGWSMTILAAGIIFVARSDIKSIYILWSFIIPIVGFWFLDGNFLRNERLFRKVYDEIRQQESTDFNMDHMKHKNEPKCSLMDSILSDTLIKFYGIEILFVVAVFLFLSFRESIKQ